MENNLQRNMILNDNLWKVMLKLSWPAVIAMVLFGLNVVFDAIFVGRYVGEVALAGVSIAYPITQLSLGFGSLVGVGAGSLLSIAIGEEDYDLQKKIIGSSNFLVIIVGIIFAILGFIFLNPLMKLMGASGENLIYGSNYLKIALLGSIFWIGGIGYNMIIRAEGKMGTAAWMMGVGLIINIIANYIFMAILDFGVVGAAWGTNIGMFVYIFLFFIYCSKGKASFKTEHFRIIKEKETIGKILSLGFPSLLMTIMSVIQGMIILFSLNHYGTTQDVAFYGIVFRLFNLFLTPIYGLMRALQPAVGINYGASKYDRVISSYKIFAFAAFIIMLPFWLIAMFSPISVLQLMLPGKEFLANDIRNFRIFISIAPFLSLVLNAMTFWPAIDKPKPAAIIGIVRQVFLYIPAMLILPKLFGISSIYKGSFIIDFFLTIVVCLMIFKDFNYLRQKPNLKPKNI